MWKVVITEIQDANTIDPTCAPPGAFFVSTERFAQTVDYLDLAKVISIINCTQSSLEPENPKRSMLSEKIPSLKTNHLAELEHAR